MAIDAPAPNAYNVDNLTIAKSVIREEDEDPELLPKREPFNSSQPRFKEPKRGKPTDISVLISLLFRT